MKKDFLRKDLLNLMAKAICQNGFKLNINQNRFTNKKLDGSNTFHIIFLNKTDWWELIPGMSIRKNIVENIYHKISGFSKTAQLGTPTIAISVENYLKDKNQNYEFYLKCPEDVDNLSASFIEIFHQIVMPFFIKYDNLDAIEKIVNDNSPDTSFTGAIHKGTTGIILAKLLHRSNYHELVELYSKHYKWIDDGFYFPQYERLVKYLENDFSE